MRNKERKTGRFGIGLPAVLALAVAGVQSLLAFEPQEEPPAQTPPAQSTPQDKAPEEKPAPPAETAPAADAEADDSAQEANAPKRFIPSTRSTADNSATFPVDI